MAKSKVSIILAVYNSEKYLEKFFSSLFIQTFKDYELIIVDDGSSDNSRAILDRLILENTDRAVSCVTQKNMGPAGARNTGLGMATGEYVLFLDTDDRIEPDMLERLYKTAVEYNADMVVCGYERVDAFTDKPVSREMCKHQKALLKEEDRGSIPFINASLWNKLIRRECIGERRLPDVKICEDGLFFIGLAPSLKRIAMLPEVLYYYYIYTNTAITSLTKTEYKRIREKFLEEYRRTPVEYLDQFILSAFIHLVLSLLYRLSYNIGAEIGGEIRDTRLFFKNEFPKWYKTKYMRFSFLRKKGVRGLATWFISKLFRIGLLRVYLGLYRFAIDFCKIEIKW
jgi:glycosyltransferase involved in cell wall biosynthesis